MTGRRGRTDRWGRRDVRKHGGAQEGRHARVLEATGSTRAFGPAPGRSIARGSVSRRLALRLRPAGRLPRRAKAAGLSLWLL